MSIKEELGNDYVNLDAILAPYIDQLEVKDEMLQIAGKTIEHANREQAQNLAYFDERRIELHTYVKFFEFEIDRIRAKLLKGMETYPRALTDRTKEKYIDNEEAYLKVLEKSLAVGEIYGLYVSAVEQFKARGFALRNITEIRVHSLEDVIL